MTAGDVSQLLTVLLTMFGLSSATLYFAFQLATGRFGARNATRAVVHAATLGPVLVLLVGIVYLALRWRPGASNQAVAPAAIGPWFIVSGTGCLSLLMLSIVWRLRPATVARRAARRMRCARVGRYSDRRRLREQPSSPIHLTKSPRTILPSIGLHATLPNPLGGPLFEPLPTRISPFVLGRVKRLVRTLRAGRVRQDPTRMMVELHASALTRDDVSLAEDVGTALRREFRRSFARLDHLDGFDLIKGRILAMERHVRSKPHSSLVVDLVDTTAALAGAAEDGQTISAALRLAAQVGTRDLKTPEAAAAAIDAARRLSEMPLSSRAAIDAIAIIAEEITSWPPGPTRFLTTPVSPFDDLCDALRSLSDRYLERSDGNTARWLQLRVFEVLTGHLPGAREPQEVASFMHLYGFLGRKGAQRGWMNTTLCAIRDLSVMLEKTQAMVHPEGDLYRQSALVDIAEMTMWASFREDTQGTGISATDAANHGFKTLGKQTPPGGLEYVAQEQYHHRSYGVPGERLREFLGRLQRSVDEQLGFAVWFDEMTGGASGP